MAATGLLTKGIQLHYKATQAGTYTALADLQSIPDIGGTPEKVDVTTLDDGAKRSIKGLQDYGELEFEFLYDNSANSSYRLIRALEEAGTVAYWKLTFPDETAFTWTGEVTTKISGAGVNEALKFVANIQTNSEIAVANPA